MKSKKSSLFKLVMFNLKTNKKTLFGWCIALFLIMFLYMILFPSMKDLATIKMESMPKEFLQIMGMEGLSDMANYISYFGMVYNILLLVISIFIATFSSKLLLGEEKNGTIECINSLPISRNEIYYSKLITAYVSVILVMLFATLSAFICGLIGGGETFVFKDFFVIIKLSSFSPLFFMAVSFLLAGVSSKIGISTITGMVVVGTYLIGYLGNLLEDKAEWLVQLSPLALFTPTNVLRLEKSIIISLLIYFLIGIFCVIFGGVIYNKRDFHIN